MHRQAEAAADTYEFETTNHNYKVTFGEAKAGVGGAGCTLFLGRALSLPGEKETERAVVVKKGAVSDADLYLKPIRLTMTSLHIPTLAHIHMLPANQNPKPLAPPRRNNPPPHPHPHPSAPRFHDGQDKKLLLSSVLFGAPVVS